MQDADTFQPQHWSMSSTIIWQINSKRKYEVIKVL